MFEKMFIDAVENFEYDNVLRLTNMKRYHMVLEKLHEANVDIKPSKWDFLYRTTIKVERKDLPKIRKMFGKLKVGYKSIGPIVDKQQMVDVRFYLKDEKWDGVAFVYCTPYKDGGRCKIKEVQSEPYKTLVCDL
jgi:hypothetical protein